MAKADELIRIQMEVMSGAEWGAPGTKVAQTAENRKIWDAVAADIKAMEAKGLVPEIPYEADL